VHGAGLAVDSSAHRNIAPVSPVNANVAPVEFTRPVGPAVIAGHVTWNQQPAVFFRLAELRRGDVVEVVRDDDRVARFRVTAVATYPKARFATNAVFGGIDYAGLRLITCGGDFDRSAHRYRDNVVVFARLASTRPVRRAGG